jgi:hypothetical protein
MILNSFPNCECYHVTREVNYAGIVLAKEACNTSLKGLGYLKLQDLSMILF